MQRLHPHIDRSCPPPASGASTLPRHPRRAWEWSPFAGYPSSTASTLRLTSPLRCMACIADLTQRGGGRQAFRVRQASPELPGLLHFLLVFSQDGIRFGFTVNQWPFPVPVDGAEIHFPLDDFAALDLSLDRFHIVASYRQFSRQLSPSQPPNNRPQLPHN